MRTLVGSPFRDFPFEFTKRWFYKRNVDTFRRFVEPVWKGRPIVYLEVGVFEGMSLSWMMQNVLIHPESRAVGIDPWLMTTELDEAEMASVMTRAHDNLRVWTERDRCRLIRGSSSEILRRMNREGGFAGIERGTVDLCLVDGGHNALAVLDDAIQCFHLLKKGGWLVFDDVEQEIPKSDHVKAGVLIFASLQKGAEFVWKDGFVEAYEKD